MKSEVNSLEVGGTYYFQTGRYDWIGEVVSIDGPYSVTLKNASCVFQSGRMSVFVRIGKTDNMQIEFIGTVGLVWISWSVFPHKLPNKSHPNPT